ncbi:hypothetical protein [Streptomyces sp. NPDC048191]|uniref:hypothetical protein n=1 Tax=Streptomyces sp. NPDC048191 TaxID=3155484 RepID=UPI0033BFEBAD
MAPTTQISTTSRSDTFSIRVVSVPSPVEAEAGVGAVGRITVRDFGENFPMDLTCWDVELAELFDGIFMLLEDYEVEPDLREPGDLSASELFAAAREVWDTFRRSGAE